MSNVEDEEVEPMNRAQACPVAVLLVFAALIAVPAAAQGPEDVGVPGDSPKPLGTVTEIPAMTIPNVVLDFDAMPAGATTVAAIQAAFPGSALSNLTFVTRAGAAGYDFQTGGGRALVPSDLAGSLALVDALGGFQNDDALIVDLSVPSTEMGFEIGDWGGPFNAEAYDGAVLIGTVTASTAGDDRDHFIQSTTPFNRVILTALPQNPPANWAVPALHLGLGEADLDLTKTVDPTTVEPGDSVTYTLTVTNNGPADAGNTVVTDNLPAEFTWTGDDCGAGPPAGGPPNGTLIWNVGTLANGAMATCNVTGTMDGPSGTMATNSATATSDASDPTPPTAAATVTIELIPSVLEIPTLSQVGIALLLLLLAGAAIWALRRSPQV